MTESSSRAQFVDEPRERDVLTERVIGRLPGPRVLWIIAWAVAPIGLSGVLSSMAAESSEVSVFEIEAIGAAISVYVVGLALWAAPYLTREARRLKTLVTELAETGTDPRWLGGIASTAGPVLLAVSITILEDVGLVPPLGVMDLLVLFWIQFLEHLPLATGVWVVWTILVSVYRLGQVDLRLDSHSGDSTLGLEPIGRMAVLAFGIFAAGLAPILLANTDSGVAVAINGGTFLIVVGVFVGALWGIHRQMLKTRDEALSQARRQLGRVSTRIASSTEPTLNDRDATLLLATDILERRAREIAAWPMTGGLYVRTGAILSGVLILLITRVIATALGV